MVRFWPTLYETPIKIQQKKVSNSIAELLGFRCSSVQFYCVTHTATLYMVVVVYTKLSNFSYDSVDLNHN